MREDKAEITRALLPVLQKTRQYGTLTDLVYEKVAEGYERVIATFDDGCTVNINVSWDSGAALIRDVMRGLA